MMGYYGNNFMDGWSFFGAIIMVVFWVLVVWGIVMLVRWASCPGGNCRHRHHMMMGHMGGHHGMNGHMGGGDSALKILKERYAKGEISKEEYEERKQVLMS